jgi:hypothetical protein
VKRFKWIVLAILAAAGPHPAPAEPTRTFTLSAPPGLCAFEPGALENTGLVTGFKPGVKDASVLLALFVPCDTLKMARAGSVSWLPEWAAFEKNTLTMPSDDERNTQGTGREAVRTLCHDAEARHWQIDAVTFEAKTAAAHRSLSEQNPVVYFGVIGHDAGACFMASLSLETDPAGVKHRLLNVFAFMAVGDVWVYHTTRRLAADASTAEQTLFTAKTAARAFLRDNS